jgi:pSer/pThr/pTyr-binding forkhead associated (FHA) protein
MAKSKLICLLDNRIIGEHLLDKERINIGRRQNNDIVIDNLSVSGLHAFIVSIGKESFLEDANSTNGTFVNLKPVRKHLLEQDDVIEIGRHQFKFVKGNSTILKGKIEASNEAGSTPLDKAPNTKPPSLQSLIQQSKGSAHENEPLSETTPIPIEAIKPPIAKLHFLSGTNNGKTLTLTKTLTTFGKQGGQVIVVTKRANGYFLSQVEGDTTPSINGNAMRPRAYALQNHDILEISGVKMEFLIT